MGGELGVGMVWGFPNTQSHYGFVHRLGWHDVGLIVTMTRETERIPDSAPKLTRLDAVGDRVSALCERSADGRNYPSSRDARYLRWRYLNHPNGDYAVLALDDAPEAVAVVKSYALSGRKALEVVDVVYGKNPDTFGSMMAGILAHARDTGHALVRTWLSMADPAFPALEKLAFAPKEPIAYFGGRTLGSFSLNPDELRGDRWVVSMGDSDNY
jgi:hypothetical protein